MIRERRYFSSLLTSQIGGGIFWVDLKHTRSNDVLKRKHVQYDAIMWSSFSVICEHFPASVCAVSFSHSRCHSFEQEQEQLTAEIVECADDG